jgi:hypothetical protein
MRDEADLEAYTKTFRDITLRQLGEGARVDADRFDRVDNMIVHRLELTAPPRRGGMGGCARAQPSPDESDVHYLIAHYFVRQPGDDSGFLKITYGGPVDQYEELRAESEALLNSVTYGRETTAEFFDPGAPEVLLLTADDAAASAGKRRGGSTWMLLIGLVLVVWMLTRRRRREPAA